MMGKCLRRSLAVLLVLAPCAVVGCSDRPAPADRSAAGATAPAELRLAVVDDPAMAEAIDRLRADWKARTGASLSVSRITRAEMLAAADLPERLDAMVYPSAQLGPLAERGWIRPLPADYKSNAELAWPDLFELLQVAEAAWGGKAHGVPFGSPVLTCLYRADLLERGRRKPPATWSEYHELAEWLSRRENLGDAAPPAESAWSGTVEPLAAGWAGRTLLARAAAYAKHRDHYSTLFNIESMEPLVATAAFTRALEELAADAKLGPPNVLELDPAGVRREFFAGRAALALSWPTHADSAETKIADERMTIGFCELPGAAKMFNAATKAWENRAVEEDRHVTLLGYSGRIGSIARDSAHPDQSLALLAWLVSRQWGATVSGASSATTLFRKSQLRGPQPWLETSIDAEAGQQYAASVRDALGRPVYLFALRIPGQEKYLAALDTAVHKAVRGEQTPAEALLEAAAAWTAITHELGIEAQRKAYRNSLGLEP